MQFITRHCNPFINGQQPLKNIVTQELVTNECSNILVNIFRNGCITYETFFKERFIEKSKSLSVTIPRVKLPSFKTIMKPKTVPSNNISLMNKCKMAQRIIELAKERYFNFRRLFSFELCENNFLFNDDGTLKKEQSKSNLVKEMESMYLQNEKNLYINDLTGFTVIVDVMLKCRQLKWKNMQTFDDFANEFCSSVTYFIKGKVDRLDFIFDTYLDNSIKIGERLFRYKEQPIDMHKIDENVPMPKQENLFWGSNKNKTLLQNFLRKSIFEKNSKIWPETQVICSATNAMLCESNLVEITETFNILQRPDIEEADSRIILHIFHACKTGKKNILVLSSDTDVCILLLYYWKAFQEMGLQVN